MAAFTCTASVSAITFQADLYRGGAVVASKSDTIYRRAGQQLRSVTFYFGTACVSGAYWIFASGSAPGAASQAYTPTANIIC